MKDFKPNRSEFLKIKKRIDLARKGHKLLKMKRDGLIVEFFKVLKEAKTLRAEIVETYVAARRMEAIAESIEGKIAVESAALALKDVPRVHVETANVMGVKVPQVISRAKDIGEMPLGIGIIGTGISIEEAARSYAHLLQLIIRAAQYETELRRLIEEIDKVKRRVNALEFKVIPELKHAEGLIRFRLEELERENVFRLKRMKD
jgi:V/A-type H+-transporting ATPase subunit D